MLCALVSSLALTTFIGVKKALTCVFGAPDRPRLSRDRRHHSAFEHSHVGPRARLASRRGQRSRMCAYACASLRTQRRQRVRAAPGTFVAHGRGSSNLSFNCSSASSCSSSPLLVLIFFIFLSTTLSPFFLGLLVLLPAPLAIPLVLISSSSFSVCIGLRVAPHVQFSLL